MMQGPQPLFAGHSWQLEVYPGGKKATDEGFISGMCFCLKLMKKTDLQAC